MADITFTNLSAALPAGSIIDDNANNDVRISLKALMGETAVDVADAKVAEAISKLLDGCFTAQSTYNEGNPTNDPDLSTFSEPAAGIPIQDEDGNWAASFTYTVSVNVPLSKNLTTGVTL